MSSEQDDKIDLGNRIREARNSAGMYRQELANAIGSSTRSIAGWEMGECAPTYKYLRRVAGVLDVSCGWLCGEGPYRLPLTCSGGYEVHRDPNTSLRSLLVKPGNTRLILSLRETAAAHMENRQPGAEVFDTLNGLLAAMMDVELINQRIR